MSTPAKSTSNRSVEQFQVKLPLARKLTFAFATVGLVATIVTALIAYQVSSSSLRQSAFSQLQSVQNVLKDSIEFYLKNARNDLASMADSVTVRSALTELSDARKGLKQELTQNGAKVDAPTLAAVRDQVQGYYSSVLITNLAKVRQSDAGSASAYMHKDDEANLLQYMFTVANPAAVGSKYLNTTRADLEKYSEVEPSLREAFSKTTYAGRHEFYHRILTDHRVRQGYYDIFICDLDGYVVYTNFKELDFQGNLRFGPEKDTGLGKAYEAGLQIKRDGDADSSVFSTDMAPYPKSYDAPAIFISTPITDAKGAIAGVFIYQLPLDRINAVMTFNGRQEAIGLGKSGEAYLVGPDAVQRTDSRFLSDVIPSSKKRVVSSDAKSTSETTMGVLRVDTHGVREALAGRPGLEVYPDYRNVPVLGAFDRLKVPGLNWAVLVEQDVSEAFAPARRLAYLVLGAGLVLAVLMSIAGVKFSQIVARPVEELESTMKKVAAGDDSARSSVTSTDEIGRLSVTFNDMIEERNTVQNKILTENERLQANIRDLLSVVSDASEGSLSVRAKVTEGALGNVASALNEMLENFGDLIQNAKSASTRVATAATQIESASKQMAEGANTQTSQVGQTAENVKGLTENARAVVENSTVASQSASQTRAAAEQGANAVREVVIGMDKIRETVQANSKKIKRLGDRTMEISGIVRVISDISVQTDMLALNAAMEATRAGEQGKNFAVVADEVRNLSDRAKKLTVEIEKLVNGILSETAEAVQQMEMQTQEVETGARKVELAGQSLQNIVESSSQSVELVSRISRSANEQASRAEVMMQSVGGIRKIVDTTRDRATSTLTTSEQLARLSGDLDQQLSKFTVSN
jgi:methyl-accepting chemotaxis protein